MEARPGGKEPSTAYISEMGLPPSLLKAQQIWGGGAVRWAPLQHGKLCPQRQKGHVFISEKEALLVSAFQGLS